MSTCNRKKALCVFVPFGVIFSCLLFILGIFEGPIWLLAISVLVGMVAVLVLGYLYNNSYATNPMSLSNVYLDNNNSINTSNLNPDIDGSILPPFCIYDVKLPTYDDVLEEKRQNSSLTGSSEEPESPPLVTQQQSENNYFQVIGMLN